MDVEERADVMLDALEQLPDRESRKPVAVQHMESYAAQCVRESEARIRALVDDMQRYLEELAARVHQLEKEKLGGP